MPEPDDEVLALAAAVLDGTPVDWDAELVAATDVTRPIIERLRLVAGVHPFPGEAAAPAARPLAAGEQWGSLRLMDRLGAGSNSEVWRAWDARLEREVALKLLPLDERADASRRDVIHEGRLLARVRHPHVVTIHGAEAREGRVGLWMELVEGNDLESVVRSDGKVTPSEIVRIGSTVCDALQAVHDAGVLHRDVKAQNIRRTPDGRIVLMDFGSGRDLTHTGQAPNDLSGTPLYLAPEVYTGGSATRQSDIYSVGVLLFRLLTGEFPVTGRTVRDIARAHRDGQVRRLRALRPEVPRQLAFVIERALARDPVRRFTRADEFGRALVAADPRRQKKRAAYAALLAVAVVSAAWEIRQWWRPAPAEQSAASPGSGMVQRQLLPPYSPGMLGAPSPDGRSCRTRTVAPATWPSSICRRTAFVC